MIIATQIKTKVVAVENSVVWFQNDLRLEDHRALTAAVERGYPTFCVYIYDSTLGSACNWWLHHSLEKFSSSLKEKGGSLVLLQGDPKLELLRFVKDHKISHLFTISDHLEWRVELEKIGCKVTTYPSSLFPIGSVLSGKGDPYRMFTPFWNACLKEPSPRKPLQAPKMIPKAPVCKSNKIDLLPKLPWADQFPVYWRPGELGAKKMLETFKSKQQYYLKDRDFVDRKGTSMLSPYLRFGEISAETLWHEIDNEAFRRQLIWRDFAKMVLYFFDEPPRSKKWEAFPWRHDPKGLKAWQEGRTGYPIVDAAMRQLWRYGWMHGRARMIVASFLVKDLQIHWKEGETWFWDTLVDADLANNLFGWQWVAGIGFDSAPYYRMFNPILQSKKFDPQGEYIREFIPELKHVESKWIHTPWLFPGKLNYPSPIVNHEIARKNALDAYHKLE